MWLKKRSRSTFFPQNWSEQRIKEEIAFAYGNKQPVGNKQFEFVGKTTDGIDVTIFIDKSGNITSAFPIFPNTKK